jgi:hypothetical protein
MWCVCVRVGSECVRVFVGIKTYSHFHDLLLSMNIYCVCFDIKRRKHE